MINKSIKRTYVIKGVSGSYLGYLDPKPRTNCAQVRTRAPDAQIQSWPSRVSPTESGRSRTVIDREAGKIVSHSNRD